MQVFRTRFTADVTQIRTAMAEMRDNVRGAMDSFRRVAAVGSIAFAGSGISAGMLAKSMISLAANMEKTKVAFEVMLGGAERAKVVLGDLVKFADVTPFDTAEIIQAGRSLIACGTATDQLTDRLTLLGNIAAGTGMTILDMTSLYAKMKNTGKVQTEELNQMAERGIPIYRLLTEMLRVNQTELASMAEKGQLSFALIEEALEKLGGKGGQYFGLIAKQSKTLDGLWSTLQGNIRLLATELGELVIPELSKNLENVIAKLEEMKKTGELDRIMRKTADAIVQVLRSLKDIALFLAENRDKILDTAGVIACWYAWGQLQGVLVSTGRVLRSLQGLDFVSGFRSLRRASPIVKVLTADITALRIATGTLGTALQTVAAAAAVAFTSWKIGERLAELFELEKVFTRMFLKARGMSDSDIDRAMSGKKIDLKEMDLDALNKRREKLFAFVREVRNIESAGRRIQEGMKEFGYVQDESEVPEERHKAYAAYLKDLEEYNKGKQTLETWHENKEKILDEINAIDARRRVLKAEIEKKKKAAEAEKKKKEAERAPGGKTSAADEAIAARDKAKREKEREEQEKLAKKERDLLRGIAQERKSGAKAWRDMADAENHDFVTQRIQGWREEIEKYESEIDKAEKKLQRFGATLEDDLLKSPEQIAQDRKDEILRKKIDAYNQGAKVTFTKEEQSRIQELQHEQKRARLAMEGKTSNESSIRSAERSLDAYDRRREIEDRRERANELKNRAATMKAAEDQLRIAKEANQPLEAVLKKIEEILKGGLPNQTV